VHIPLATTKQVGGAWAINVSSASVSETDYVVPVRPVRWEWHRSEAGFTVCDHVTGVFGFGSDLNEAIRDLAHALGEHRDVLERQDLLSPDLERQLKYLQEFPV
jgi:hypothetical protein